MTQNQITGRVFADTAAVLFALAKKVKKVTGSGIYIPPLTGKPEQQRFTMRSGALTSIGSRH